jgi:hypothetical protein
MFPLSGKAAPNWRPPSQVAGDSLPTALAQPMVCAAYGSEGGRRRRQPDRGGLWCR